MSVAAHDGVGCCELFPCLAANLSHTPSTTLRDCCSFDIDDRKTPSSLVGPPLADVNPGPSRGPTIGLPLASGGVSIAVEDIGLPREAVSVWSTEFGASATNEAGVLPSPDAVCPLNSASALAFRLSSFFFLS